MRACPPLKSLRKYWGKEFADRITHVRRIVFDNPQFHVETTFDKVDFTRILVDSFGVDPATVDAFFAALIARQTALSPEETA